MQRGWDDFKWSIVHGEEELKMATKFDDFCPAALMGTLIAHLHRTIGNESTDPSLVRANAVILTTKEDDRVFMCF